MESNEVKNIYCVGRNYKNHAKELGNAIPSSPLIFTKPSHSLQSSEGEVSLPFQLGEIQYEVEIVVKLAGPYQDYMPLHTIIKEMAIGIDFTARDLQHNLKEKGHPWTLAKGFKGAAVISPFIPFPGEQTFQQLQFSLYKQEKVVQTGSPQNMLFSIRDIISYIDTHLGTGKDDIIFTGTPEGVGAVNSGDSFKMELINPIDEQVHYFGPLVIS
ncbi:fumarylacetoacetate hydrolase family protein [Pontibacillus salicampi]|uniref:Fumarylacetoacetate hydrolase family protein n=1 Tax=Pontibacillus salicampi TaxID=1449801 RepID=A0ABV6LIU7_9BACI